MPDNNDELTEAEIAEREGLTDAEIAEREANTAQFLSTKEKLSGNFLQDTWDDLRGKTAARAAEEAAQVQSDAYGQGIDEQRRQFDISQENLAPWLEAGTGALSRQQDFLGLGEPGAQQAAYDNYAESPGQKFLRERGERALVRNASAIGGLGGGNVRSALNQQGIGFAAQDFGNHYNRLAGMSGTGQQTASGLGSMGMNMASNVGNLYGQQGNAAASGILGSAQSRSSGLGNMIGLGSMLFGGMGGGGGGGLTADTANKIQSHRF